MQHLQVLIPRLYFSSEHKKSKEKIVKFLKKISIFSAKSIKTHRCFYLTDKLCLFFPWAAYRAAVFPLAQNRAVCRSPEAQHKPRG